MRARGRIYLITRDRDALEQYCEKNGLRRASIKDQYGKYWMVINS